MAKLFPSMDTIKKMKPKPTEGELFLLNKLNEELLDDDEVYYQAHLNGCFPDVVILRKDCGALIIEVKDWNLSSYSINPSEGERHNQWYVQTSRGDQPIKSPVEQVLDYKRMLYQFYSLKLAEKKLLLGNKGYNIIGTAVYFHKADSKEPLAIEAANESQFAEVFCKNQLDRKFFCRHLMEKYNKPSKNFSDDVYKEFQRLLQPIEHVRNEGKPIEYNSEQKKFIDSRRNIKQKIRGVAGCGKTKILAKRAVNAYLKTRKPVLILTFNIALRNYIKDMISEVREDFPWSAFEIIHYHGFIKKYKAKNELNDEGDIVEHFPRKYATILVDEAQDYEEAWVETIHNMLAPKGELVFFGDEKQNVYNRKLDANKQIFTKIPGRWNELKHSFRVSNAVSELLNEFQAAFLKQKYIYEKIESTQLSLENSIISYYHLDEFFPEIIVKIYRQFIENNNIHDNEVCFLSSYINDLRLLEVNFQKIGYNTMTTFESEDYYNIAKEQYPTKKALNNALIDFRRIKKRHFQMNSGKLKLATIHSFKGWEVENIFLIINNNNENNQDSNLEEDCVQKAKEELIYTGISRSKKNLIVLEIGDSKFTSFFKSNMPYQHISFNNNEENINIINNDEKELYIEKDKYRDSELDILIQKSQIKNNELNQLLEKERIINNLEKELKTVKEKQIKLMADVNFARKEAQIYSNAIEELSEKANSNEDEIATLKNKLSDKEYQIENYEEVLNEITQNNYNQDENIDKINELKQDLALTKQKLYEKSEPLIIQMDNLWKIHFPRFIYDKKFLKEVVKFELDIRLALEQVLVEIDKNQDNQKLLSQNRGKIRKADCCHISVRKDYRLDYKISKDKKIELIKFYHKGDFHKNMYSKY